MKSKSLSHLLKKRYVDTLYSIFNYRIDLKKPHTNKEFKNIVSIILSRRDSFVSILELEYFLEGRLTFEKINLIHSKIINSLNELSLFNFAEIFIWYCSLKVSLAAITDQDALSILAGYTIRSYSIAFIGKDNEFDLDILSVRVVYDNLIKAINRRKYSMTESQWLKYSLNILHNFSMVYIENAAFRENEKLSIFRKIQHREKEIRESK